MTHLCVLHECPKPEYRSSFLCRTHRNRLRQTGTPYAQSLIERFWTLFRRDESTGCWVWLGYSHRKGYGQFLNTGAHRVSYELLVGEIPAGLVLDHLCRNKSCVNPAHLEPVTNAENVRRAGSFRLTGACMSGHAMTPENTYVVPSSGRRQCRTCRAAYSREQSRRERAARRLARQTNAADSGQPAALTPTDSDSTREV